MNIEATNITVIRPGISIQMEMSEAKALWVELQETWNVNTPRSLHLMKALIDALHKEIG